MRGDARESTPELRCVAPLVVLAESGPQLVGSCTLVTNGQQAIAVASSEVLRRAGEPLAILTRLDGSSHVPVKAWSLARHAAIGIVELGEGVAFTPEVHPIHLGSLSAAVETRGAPAALIAAIPLEQSFARELVPIELVLDDGGGMADEITRVAKPSEQTSALLDGSPLFAWMPPDPVLGRGSETIAIALGILARGRIELVGLEAVGRALPWAEHTPPPSNELPQVAGEIVKE
ncbi:MAG TPA: hypothetical protein VGC41_28240 [Kofleriaceae bacterium]